MTDGIPAPDGAVSPDAQAAPKTAPITVVVRHEHYHQMVPAGFAARVSHLMYVLGTKLVAGLEWAHQHRKAIIAAAPAVVTFAAARGVTVPAVLLAVLPFVVGAVPNRKPAA